MTPQHRRLSATRRPYYADEFPPRDRHADGTQDVFGCQNTDQIPVLRRSVIATCRQMRHRAQVDRTRGLHPVLRQTCVAQLLPQRCLRPRWMHIDNSQ